MTLSLVLMMLAVARVTRLITSDVLFDAPRIRVIHDILKGNPEGSVRTALAYLVTCNWCSSIYVGAAGAGAWYAWGETMPFMVITAALAASYATGFLASLTEG